MSTIKADAISSKTTNTDLTISADGTGVPNIEAGFKVGGTAGVPVSSLRDGTDGELITWDASGNATTVPVGTATHLLTSNGAGAAPTFQAAAGGGAWSYISNVDVTEVTNIDFTGLDSTYVVYMWQFSGVMGVNNAPALHWRFGTGASPTYATTRYSFVYDRTLSGAATYIQANAERGAYGIFAAYAGPGTAVSEPVDGPYGYYGQMYLMGHADSDQHARVHYTGSGFTLAGDNTIIFDTAGNRDAISTADGVGYYGLTTNVTAMRFYCSYGDWSGENSTTIKLYGLSSS